MADTVSTIYRYPPNFDGYYANNKGTRRMVVQFTNLSDGTGESDVIKLVREDLRGTNGDVCKKLCIEKIEYHTYGMGVHIEYDMNPQQTIAQIAQSSHGIMPGPWSPDLNEDDDYEVGETGNILFTTIAAASNDTYDITLHLVVKE